MELKEDNNWLADLFVLPGTNPALDIIANVKKSKVKNDINNYAIDFMQENQQLIMLKRNRHNEKVIKSYRKMEDLAISYDSTLFIPLYLSKEEKLKKSKSSAQTLRRSSKSSPEDAHLMYEKLFSDLSDNINIYNNSMVLFGKHFISPLANTANVYYRYYLMDSLKSDLTKQYQIKFKSKNSKNLAFNGHLWVDSATYAITKFEGELPFQSNINFIKNLKIKIDFEPLDNKMWLPACTETSLNMNYQLFSDSISLSSEIYLEKRNLTKMVDDPNVITDSKFIMKNLTQVEVEQKMTEINKTPIMKTAKWIADGILTGYARVGCIDIGKVYYLARLSDIEGVRVSLPFRTNARLFENFEFGGSWGYGFRNKKHNYSVHASWKLPLDRKTVISAGYVDDYRRVDYDYNGFLLRENPLLSGDEDIANTVFGFRFSRRINHRKEFYSSLSHDWNDNTESKIFFRKNTYSGSQALMFEKNNIDISSIEHHSISLTTRFSKNERNYEDHLSRIYIRNFQPVIYFTLEGGKAKVQHEDLYYAKASTNISQTMLFQQGEWTYAFDAGWQYGKMPYNLLWIPQGSETNMFKRYQYNMMNYMEFAFDRYLSMHNELVFNGLIFNHLPLIRKLNLREMLSFKCLYGSLSNQHATVVDFPTHLKSLSYPYVELGVGITNILRLFSLQSIWRVNEFGDPGVRSWRIMAGMRVSF